MSTVEFDVLAEVERLGNNLDDLTKFAYGPQDAVMEHGVENTFGWIVDALWALNEQAEQDLSARFLDKLDSLPNGMRQRFDEWADREGRVLPEFKGGGGSVRWVIAPEMGEPEKGGGTVRWLIAPDIG